MELGAVLVEAADVVVAYAVGVCDSENLQRRVVQFMAVVEGGRFVANGLRVCCATLCRQLVNRGVVVPKLGQGLGNVVPGTGEYLLEELALVTVGSERGRG